MKKSTSHLVHIIVDIVQDELRWLRCPSHKAAYLHPALRSDSDIGTKSFFTLRICRYSSTELNIPLCSFKYNKVQCTLILGRMLLFCLAKRLVYFAERQSCRAAAEIDN